MLLDLKIRKADKEDLKEIQSLFVHTIRSVCFKDYAPAQIDEWCASIENKERWQNAVKYQYFRVAIFENQIVGFGSLESNNYLDFLYVHRDFQSKGVASLLLEDIESVSRSENVRVLSSNVSKTAKGFFEIKGFTVKKENVRGGVEIVNYHMIKYLSIIIIGLMAVV